ncbi:LPXTG cell wall anchor domain-containing protein [Corynebacterium diphtheriae]|nr:LPXTG cell wall anchor domain-containing protein [Corynebacterium diphtheriae]
MFSMALRWSKSMCTKFHVFSILLLSLVLIFASQAPTLSAPTASAQTETITTTPGVQQFQFTRNAPATVRFTADRDATVNSLSFTVNSKNNSPEFVQKYEVIVNGTKLAPQFSPSGSPRRTPLTITHSNLNIAVQQGSTIEITPFFTHLRVNGSVSLSLQGASSTAEQPVPTEPAPPEEPSIPAEPSPSNPTPPVEAEPQSQDFTVIVPAPPTLIDPATAPQCVEKAYINIPDTQGIDYLLNGEKRPGGQHIFEQNTRSTVTVIATAQPGFQLLGGAQAEWKFELSGETKDCSHAPDGPHLPGDVERVFEAAGHDFAVTADSVNPQRPNTFTARVNENSHFKYATVRIEAHRKFLEPQKYGLSLDRIEDGATLQKRNVNIGDGFITMDVFPVKNGKPVDSAVVPKDAVFTFTNNLAENRKLKVTLDVYSAQKNAPEQPEIISPPDGAHWVHGRVPNPPLPQQCGLRVAVVADFSTSLKHADSDAYAASRNAANNLIEALAGSPAEIGLYNFATNAPQVANATTHKQNPKYRQGPPYISLRNRQGVDEAKRIVTNWTSGGGSTNWEGGLRQISDGNYDVVYFITDGMPTFSSKSRELGLGGDFVQASALNQAIDAANDLKKAGTRIVPIMIDLTLGGTSKSRHTVTEDLVLKDIKRIALQATPPREPGIYFKINSGREPLANYIDTWTMANLKVAFESPKSGKGNRATVQVFERRSDGGGSYITNNQQKWTYGPRGFKTMGEDISGTGDTIRIEQYSLLAGQLAKIGQNLAANCEGHIEVKKRIVDENGTVLTDGAPGWEFTLSARENIIETFSNDRVRTSSKTTSGSDADKGQASWSIDSNKSQELLLTETQKPGYSLFRRGASLDSTGEFNAVCTAKRGTAETRLKVENNGEFGFKVQLPAANGALSLVSCVVDNYEVPKAPPGRLTLEKAAYNDGNDIEILPGLGGARFAIYPSKGNQPDLSIEPVYTIIPGQESVEITTTGTFYLVETQAPSGFSLLPAPVPFEIGYDKKSKKYTISVVGGESHPLIRTKGEGELMVMQVADIKTGVIPKTGGVGVIPWALAGAILIVVGFFGLRRRNA